MTRSIAGSESLFERSKKVSPGGVHSPVRAFRGVGGTPRFIREAKGAELIDVDGNRYIDFCMSWGPLILGHQDPDVADAVRAALTRGWSYGAAEPYSLELAELLVSEIPCLEKIRFVSSGTEAVMSALRVARGATGRPKILKFDGCFHGHADSMLVRAGSGLAEMPSPDSAGVTDSVARDTIVIPLDDDAALEEAFALHGSALACAIVEPLPANNGLLPQREDWLKKLESLCRKHGALLFFDEVISGFRAGFQGMAGRTGIKPDLVTYGKVIGGGFPVGAYGGRAELMDLVAPQGPVYQAGTLSANPVSIAAGLATLKKLRSSDAYRKLETLGSQLDAGIERIAQALPEASITLQREGSIFWIVSGARERPDPVVRAPSKIPAPHKERFARVFHALLEEGFYLAPSAFEVGFLSTAHTEAHLSSFLESFEKALGKSR